VIAVTRVCQVLNLTIKPEEDLLVIKAWMKPPNSKFQTNINYQNFNVKNKYFRSSNVSVIGIWTFFSSWNLVLAPQEPLRGNFCLSGGVFQSFVSFSI